MVSAHHEWLILLQLYFVIFTLMSLVWGWMRVVIVLPWLRTGLNNLITTTLYTIIHAVLIDEWMLSWLWIRHSLQMWRVLWWQWHAFSCIILYSFLLLILWLLVSRWQAGRLNSLFINNSRRLGCNYNILHFHYS